MRFMYVFSAIFFMQCFLKCSSIDTNLKLLQIMYRHGDRTPVGFYPNDPYNQTTWEKYGGLGQLTQKGMQQHREFGQYLRNTYGAFLSKYYNRQEVLARSTDVDRTLMSTYSLLSGLYPPQDYQQFDANLTWQPITVHTTSSASDMLFHPSPCGKYDVLKKEAYSSDELVSLEKQYQDLFTLAANKSGISPLNIENFWELADILFVEKTSGLKLPEWVTDDVYNKMMYLANIGFAFDYYTTEMARLTSGGVLYDWRNNINAKVKGSRDQLFLYGAHDTFVAAMVKLLNISSFINQPPYAAALVLELRQAVQTTDYYVQIYYKNNTSDQQINLQLMTIYGCDELCPLSKFLNITSDRVVADFSSACLVANNIVKNKMLTDITLIITISGLSIIALLIIIISLLNCRKYMRHDVKHEIL